MQLGGLVQVLILASRLSPLSLSLACQMRSTEARIRDCEMRPLVAASHTAWIAPSGSTGISKYLPSFHRQDWSKIRTIAVSNSTHHQSISDN